MEFKSFLSTSNIHENVAELASIEDEYNNVLKTKMSLSDSNKIRCTKCKGSENVKLCNIDPLSKTTEGNQYLLCENCRKVSFKVKIFR